MIITKKMAMLEAALRSCVAVMDRDLNGLALIQPELKEAKQALEDMYLVDAEFERWNGEGKPAAGDECELRHRSGVWGRARISYISRDVCVWTWWCTTNEISPRPVDRVAEIHELEFRPFRTPEQIASEERESEIAAMMDLFRFSDDKQEVLRAVCVSLHNEGYRKQVQP